MTERNLTTREILQPIFNRLVPSYYNTAPDDCDVPYLVYEIRGVNSEQSFNQSSLNVSVVGSVDEEEELDYILDLLEKELNFKQFVTPSIHLRTYVAGDRQDVDTGEARLILKRLNFELRQIT